MKYDPSTCKAYECICEHHPKLAECKSYFDDKKRRENKRDDDKNENRVDIQTS